MSLEKVSYVDKIEIDESNVIHVRQIIKVLENGTELSASYHRWTLNQGDSLDGQDERVIAIANALWPNNE